MGLGFDDDLVSGIDGGDAGVTLDDAFAGGHLCTLGVGAIAFAEGAFAALSVLRVGSQPLAKLSGFPIQACGALPGFLGEVGFVGQAVVLAVAFEHLLGGGFEFVGLVGEVSAGAAFGFGGVAGQLDAVDGEHFAADQALPVAEVEDLGKEFGNFFVKAGDEGGERGEVRHGIARKRYEGDVFAAQPLDTPAAHDALGVGAENDLEQHSRRIGAGAILVVAVAAVEG